MLFDLQQLFTHFWASKFDHSCNNGWNLAHINHYCTVVVISRHIRFVPVMAAVVYKKIVSTYQTCAFAMFLRVSFHIFVLCLLPFAWTGCCMLSQLLHNSLRCASFSTSRQDFSKVTGFDANESKSLTNIESGYGAFLWLRTLCTVCYVWCLCPMF